VFLDLLDQLGGDRKVAIARLEAAKAKAATEAGDVLGETVSLIGLLRDAQGDERDDLRRKVRSALQRLVESMWVLPVRRGQHLLVALQVWFRESRKHRDYFIWMPRGGGYRVVSFAEAALPGELDLRDPKNRHARELAQALESVDPAALESGGAAG
jgi:hypothetical protein